MQMVMTHVRMNKDSIDEQTSDIDEIIEKEI